MTNKLIKKKSKIRIELIDLFNFLALSSNFGRIPKYIDDRTVATHLEMAITNVQTAWNWNIVNNIFYDFSLFCYFRGSFDFNF